jgi:hypothetical protein
LDAAKAKGFCPRNVATINENFETMLAQGYEPSIIWHCNESSVQAGQNGSGWVLAKTGMRSVHSTISKELEWFLVLVCVNVARYHIPSSHIFHGKSF